MQIVISPTFQAICPHSPLFGITHYTPPHPDYGGADRFDYDANGNMTVRNKELSGQLRLVWYAKNRLSQVQDRNGDLVEQYW